MLVDLKIFERLHLRRPVTIFVIGLLLSFGAQAAPFGFRQVGIETEYEAVSPSRRFGDVSHHTILLNIVQSQFGGGKVRAGAWSRYENSAGTMFADMKDSLGREW